MLSLIFYQKNSCPMPYYLVDNIFYLQEGFYGCQLVSYELFRKPAGTERRILGELFRLFYTGREGFLVRHTWSMISLNGRPYDEQKVLISQFLEKLTKLK